jgi:RNA polymerase sigma factor (sigma-70 family)
MVSQAELDEVTREALIHVRYCFRGDQLPYSIDWDDLNQVARIAVWKASRRYNPARGACFRTYATKCARCAVTNAIRDQRFSRRACTIREPTHFEASNRTKATFYAKSDRSFRWSAIDASLIVPGLLATLPAKMREAIIRHYFNDESQTDIAKSLGVSQMEIWRRLRDGLKLLRREVSR